MQESTPVRDSTSPPHGLSLKALAILFKLRVVGLLLFAAIGGACLASDGWPGARPLLILVIAGGVTSAGASALNQYWERGTDALMSRTRGRPLINGTLRAVGWVPILGLVMVMAPPVAVAFLNLPLSFFLLLGAFIYLAVYTIWLKPRTVLNIVIGGAAGSAAVLSGSAAAGNWSHPGALTLALTLFLWTPTHFWSLAIMHRDDYAAGAIPMLPVRTTPRSAAAWVLLHTASAAVGALVLGALPGFGWAYRLAAPLAAAILIWLSACLWIDPNPRRASTLFRASNAFLGIILLLICWETVQ
jgi:protoheme IX farnesyltransferase